MDRIPWSLNPDSVGVKPAGGWLNLSLFDCQTDSRDRQETGEINRKQRATYLGEFDMLQSEGMCCSTEEEINKILTIF